MATRLNQNDDMIERMELDLTTKAQAAFAAAGLEANIHGVFSIDDLENKVEADLCQLIAVGVGYAGAEPVSPATPPNTAPGGNSAKMVNFMFVVILTVPTGQDCIQRYSATKLLTVLRRSIEGKACDGDTTNRTWAFVKEYPNIEESTDTMLFYSQVWRLALPARNF